MDWVLKRLNSLHLFEIGQYFRKLDYHIDQVQRGPIGWHEMVRLYRVSIVLLVYYITLYFLNLRPNSVWFYLDVFQVFHVNRITGLMAVFAVLNSCRFHYLLYFCNDIFVTRAVGKIVLQREFDFFQKPYDRSINHFPSFAFGLWLALFIIRLATGAVFLLTISFNAVGYIHESYHITDRALWYRKTAEFTLLSISSLLYYAWLKPFVFYCLTLSYFAINIVRIFWIRLRQTRALLYNQIEERSHAQQMLRFSILTRHLLLNLFESNRVYGNALFIFLLMQSPISSYLIIEVLLGRTRYPFLFMLQLAEQIFAIVIIHLLFAAVNDQFRRPSHRFYGLLICHHSDFPARVNLHLNLHFQLFETQKPYGFSYGQLGGLSLYSFCKFLLLYTQLLMIVYKLIQTGS